MSAAIEMNQATSKTTAATSAQELSSPTNTASSTSPERSKNGSEGSDTPRPTQKVFILMQHSRFEEDPEAEGKGRTTDIRGVYSTEDKAMKALKDLVLEWPPENAAAKAVLLEREPEMILSFYDNPLGMGYRYQANDIVEEIMWVSVEEVR